MRRIAYLMVGLCLAAVPLARAEQWSKIFTLSGKPDLRVETSDANIRVDTWDRNTVEARVTAEGWKIGEGGVKIIEHQTGNSIELEVRLPRTVCIVCFHSPSHRVDVEIQVPREGRVDLRTSDGSIRLANFKGDMDLQSSDGAVEVEGVDGTLKAHASDGQIKIAGRFDSLQLSSSDGRIEARALAGSTISSGWDLHSGDGSVTMQLPETFAADVELRTGDGHISLDMPVNVEGTLRHNSIHGKLNGGGNLLTIHTGDGSIRLEKS
jgi:phage baseplate assembly protein gpV